MKTKMTLTRALEVACKTLMADGNFTQDDRAGAYDVLMSHNVYLLQSMGKEPVTTPVTERPKTVFSTMEPKPVAKPKPEPIANFKPTHTYTGMQKKFHGQSCVIEHVKGSHKLQQATFECGSVIFASDRFFTPVNVVFVPTHTYSGHQKGLNGQPCVIEPKGLNKIATFEDGQYVVAHSDYFHALPDMRAVKPNTIGEKTVTLYSLTGTTYEMNKCGFYDGMKFEKVYTGSFNVEGMSRVVHMRSGRQARLHDKYLKAYQVTQAQYDTLKSKRETLAYKDVNF
ncbi:MAG: hypothetical protein ACRDCE_20230 [Cetobacterium sp.]|uniref:hypothetical protein n=1 Tax=Cetobacterium sp. TaxID=2071632 RepID=UPI003EE81F36